MLWPITSFVLARRNGESIPNGDLYPKRLTVIIAARNEAESISAAVGRLRRLTEFELTLIVISDGSSDGTAAEAREAGADQVIELVTPQGKTRAISHGLAACADDALVVCMDATTEVPGSSLANLVRPLSDPTIGVTSGLVLYRYPETSVGFGFERYQKLVVSTRITDSYFFSCPSVSGALCAFRKELWRDDIPSEITPDLALPLWAACQQQRAVVITAAPCYEAARSTAASVLIARLRMALQAYAFMGYVWRRRSGVASRYLLALFGQKVSRWMLPMSALLLWISATIHWPTDGIAFAIALGSTYPLARLPGGKKLFGLPAFLLVLSLAYVGALFQYLTGVRSVEWDPLR